MIEEWKDITGYEGFYQVSNLGNVRSLGRKITDSNGRNYHLKGNKIKTIPQKNRNNYHHVGLHKNGHHKQFLVHRLVANEFIPNPDNKAQVNHLDFNPENNSVSNLEWCTMEENIQHSYKARDCVAHNRKSVLQIDNETDEIVAVFACLMETGTKGYNFKNVSKCCNGERYTHRGYKWKFV